jgi:hypothetical protein
VIVDQLDQVWNSLLDLTSQFVMPNWGGLIALLPMFLLVLVVGPLLTVLALYWFVYVVRRPRTKVRFDGGPRPATLDADGRPVYPIGEPYSPRSGLIYPAGQLRDDQGELLMVVCPMCGLGRAAEIDTCGNCGLVLRVVPRARAMRPAGPPPGGASIA